MESMPRVWRLSIPTVYINFTSKYYIYTQNWSSKKIKGKFGKVKPIDSREKFDKKIEALFSKEGRKDTIISIKEEMQKAIDKENYLSSDERVLINDFINKIRKELEIKK